MMVIMMSTTMMMMTVHAHIIIIIIIVNPFGRHYLTHDHSREDVMLNIVRPTFYTTSPFSRSPNRHRHQASERSRGPVGAPADVGRVCDKLRPNFPRRLLPGPLPRVWGQVSVGHIVTCPPFRFRDRARAWVVVWGVGVPMVLVPS